jgi:hypothetical protein
MVRRATHCNGIPQRLQSGTCSSARNGGLSSARGIAHHGTDPRQLLEKLLESIFHTGISLSGLVRREMGIQRCVNVGPQPLHVCHQIAPLKSVAPVFERGPEPLQVQALGFTQR